MRRWAVLAWLVGAACGAMAWWQPAQAQTSAELNEQGQRCLRARNYACAEKAFTAMIRQRPSDPAGYALRGIALTRAEKWNAAIADLEKAMDMGEGTWDILANYSEALRHAGRTDEAVDWSYRTLTVVATLVDVRGDLASMLVGFGRHHEGLATLAGFDAQMERQGRKPYFAAQRMAIEQALIRRGARPGPPPPPLRLSRIDGFFYAPVALGDGGFAGFVVDTGASGLVLPRALLAETRAEHRVERRGVAVRLADGRTATGDVVRIARIAVGPYALADIGGFVCDGCVALLGQEVLSRFDLKSSRVIGVEFMTLTPRTPLVR